MNIIRRQNQNPFYGLDHLRDEINSLFDFSYGGLSEMDRGLLETSWSPAVDVYDSKDDIIVKADIPGLEKEDIDVTVEDNTVTIRGEKKNEQEARTEEFVRSERFYGSFYRALQLPAHVDAGKAKASYKNGTLELTLPKREEAKPKQINVDVK